MGILSDLEDDPRWMWPALALSSALLVGAAAWRFRSWRTRRAILASGGGGSPPKAQAAAESVYAGGWESQDASAGLDKKTEGGFPLSDRMLLNATCDGPAVKVVRWRYDIRLTNYFWKLWSDGERDPVMITMGILALDSPHCDWPPDVGASQWADIVWDGTLTAVSTYVGLIEDGTLVDYSHDAWDLAERGGIVPLVVWA